MVDHTSHSQQLSNKVEQQVRQLIGDLQMQLIVLRSMLEVAQGQGQEPTQPTPQPVPNPVPPPQQPEPDPKPQQQARRTNGPLHEVRS